MHDSDLTVEMDNLQIVLCHIGGDGDYGPAMCIPENFRDRVRLVVFEIRDDTTDLKAKDTFDKSGVRTTIVRKCVDEDRNSKDFFVNKFPLSSGLLSPSQLSVNEDPVYWYCSTWGENVALERVLKIETDTIDGLVSSGVIPRPDVLSIDAQGAELRILRGAADTLQNGILAVVTEVEFFEIYHGQGLFDEQMSELSKYGFRLAEIFAPQSWHPTTAAGKGFLTVGEALFLKYCITDSNTAAGYRRGCLGVEDLDVNKLVKLIVISYAFKRLSYCYVLTDYLIGTYPEEYNAIKEDESFKGIVRFYEYTKSGKKWNVFMWALVNFSDINVFLRPLRRFSNTNVICRKIKSWIKATIPSF